MPLNPGGRHPLFAHGTHTAKTRGRPFSKPLRPTAVSVETVLLHAAQVAVRALLSLAFSLGIAQASFPIASKRGSHRKHGARVLAHQLAPARLGQRRGALAYQPRRFQG